VDDLTRSLADYARGFRSVSLSQNLVDIVVDHIIDALGCAIAARDEDSARIARELADEGAVAGPGPPSSALPG
jgi:2-methylcitrate dehydratase